MTAARHRLPVAGASALLLAFAAALALAAPAGALSTRTFEVQISGYVQGSFKAESSPSGPCHRVVKEDGGIFVEWQMPKAIRARVVLPAWFSFNPRGKVEGTYRLRFHHEETQDPQCKQEPQRTFDCGEHGLDGGVASLFLPKGSPDPNAQSQPSSPGEDDLPPLPLGADSLVVRTTNAPDPRFRTCRDGPLVGDNDITVGFAGVKTLRKGQTRTFRRTGTLECQSQSFPPLKSCRIEQGVAIEVKRIR